MSSDSGSICFDRAASFYDRTRGLTPEAASAITRLLRDEMSDGLALEIGVGTGRIALPLSRAGANLIGLDLSNEMLRTLLAQAGGRLPFPLLRGDATALPFHDGSFDVALASWVLHLIADWRRVVDELVRVVRDGGLLLIDLGVLSGIDADIKRRFRDEAGITDWPRGPKDPGELTAFLAAKGATPRPLRPVVEVRRGRLEDEIKALEDGIFSVSWAVDAPTRKAAADATRRWAEARFGSLTEERRLDATHEWRAYVLS